MAPLTGVKVVALEQAVAAPLCTRHLADLGADVVKIERPDGGDFARHYDSVVRGQSAYFVWLNRGKRSVALDVKNENDRHILERLLARADVFVYNLGPGAVDRLGFGWDVLHRAHPRLVVCAISGYGQDGPYRERKAFDLLLQGESGVIAVTGTPEQPAKVGISIADIGAGVYALAAILAALRERDRSGEGAFVDISMLECLAEWMMPPAYWQLYGGTPPAREGMRHNIVCPYGPYRVGDGAYVNVAVQTERQWSAFCTEVLAAPELVSDERFRTNELRVRNRAALEAAIETKLASHTRASALAALERGDIPYGDLNDVAGLLNHPQLAARKRWSEVETPAGSVRALAAPFNIGVLGRASGAVPDLGEHTEAVKRELEGER